METGIDLNQEDEQEPYPYPFIVGEYDDRLAKRMKQRTPSWPKLAKNRKKDFGEFDKLLDTFFFSLYKDSHIEASPLTKSATQIKRILQIAESMPEWNRLNERTKQDHIMSTLATLLIGEGVVIPKNESSGGGDKQEQSEGGQEQEDSGGDLDEQAIREALAKVLSETEEALDTADTIERLWGVDPGEHSQGDVESLLKLAKTLKGSSRLQLISKLLGRLSTQMRHSQMTRTDYVPEEFVDIELGNNLNDMLPSSRMLLADKDLEILFLLRYVQRALVQQVKHGRMPQSKGPIIVLLDASGSMSDTLGNIPGVGVISRLDWAITIGLVLTLLAKEQNREFYIGIFDTRILIELKSSDGPISVETLAKAIALHPAGGTNFEVPLSRGLAVLQESLYTKADIVFITDGDCAVSEMFINNYQEVKTQRQFRTFGIACTHAKPASLQHFCDRILTVNNIIEADIVSAEVFSI